jgi:hypothetical protein
MENRLCRLVGITALLRFSDNSCVSFIPGLCSWPTVCSGMPTGGAHHPDISWFSIPQTGVNKQLPL